MSHAARAAWLASGSFVAVDPGTEHPAVAVFARGLLAHAGRVKIHARALRELEEGERARQIARLCCEDALPHLRGESPLAAVHEWPKHYGSASKGARNSADQLFPLAAIGACVATRLDAQAISPLPSEWVGQLPKSEDGDPWASPRGRLIWSRLSLLERSAVVPSHDAVDAAGLGLWVLGRLGRVHAGSA